jgi:phosphatidylinositol glycan class B
LPWPVSDAPHSVGGGAVCRRAVRRTASPARALVANGVGGLVPVVAFGAADWIAYGGFLHSYVEYVRTNLIQGRASDFGVEPIGWHFTRFSTRWTFAPPILVALVAVRLRASAIWIATAMAIIASYSVIPHKEYRFVFPAFACIVIVAAMGSSDLIERTRRWLGPRRVGRYLLAGSASIWVATSAVLAFAIRRSAMSWPARFQ